MNLKSYYQNKLNQAIHKNESIQKRILQISLLRITIFVLGFIAICYGYNLGGTIIGGIVLATLIPFLLLVKLHNRLYHQKDWHETSIRHYQAELASLENDNRAFDGGKEWMDASHPFQFRPRCVRRLFSFPNVEPYFYSPGKRNFKPLVAPTFGQEKGD